MAPIFAVSAQRLQCTHDRKAGPGMLSVAHDCSIRRHGGGCQMAGDNDPRTTIHAHDSELGRWSVAMRRVHPALLGTVTSHGSAQDASPTSATASCRARKATC
jgi:hypothetical protein